jgi:hypothetical protein
MISLNTKLKVVPSLIRLNVLALKSIFDKFHMTAQEERELDEGIQNWVRKVDMNAYEKKELQTIVNALLHDKEGRFDSEKFAYKRADIDYKKVYLGGI